MQQNLPPMSYQETEQPRQPRENVARRVDKLTTEEMRVLRECSRESFYNRCLPFALAGMAATYLAVKNGYLRSHPRWGAAGKMTAAAFMGWLVGKVSYRKKCEEKFLRLKNSPMADLIRKNRGLASEVFENESYQKIPEDDLTLQEDFKPFRNDDYYSSSSGSLNLDTDKNVRYSGLDDRERPTTDRDDSYIEQEEPPRRNVSYEELRQKNRQEHAQKGQQSSQYNQPVGTNRQWDSMENDKSTRRTAYGDQWDR